MHSVIYLQGFIYNLHRRFAFLVVCVLVRLQLICHRLIYRVAELVRDVSWLPQQLCIRVFYNNHVRF